MRPDIHSIISSGRNYNFHTHTQFCDGRSTMSEMAKAAVNAGFAHIGFTPHSPIPIESPCNMSLSDVSNYRDEVSRLNDIYGDRCTFYTGMEIDYLGPEINAAAEFFSDLELDFSISSVHFIPSQSGDYIDIDGRYERFARNMTEHFRDDIRYVVETFYRQSMEMLSRGGFDILGHFDKIAWNASLHCPGLEEQGWYQDLLEEYIRAIIDSHVIVEINTKARDPHGRFFPGEYCWKRLIDAGVTLIVNSDAHYADRIESSRREAFDILTSSGYAY